MKIIYIAPERDSAALAARALQGNAPNVALTWTQTPGSALQWLRENRDAAAVILQLHAQRCGPFVEQLRALDLTTPVVVVDQSARLEHSVDAINEGAGGYVAGQTVETDLPRIVAVAVERERRRREPIARTLTELEATRERAERRIADVQAQHTASLAREARICAALQQRLFELESAVRNADERRASGAASFADQLARRHAEFTASLTQAAQLRDTLVAQLSAATAALEETQQTRRADAASVEHLRRREEELRAELTEAAAARTTLEAALAEAEAAHREFRQHSESDLAAANERQAALEDLLNQEAERRARLDQELAALEAARQEAARRHTMELAEAAAATSTLEARWTEADAAHREFRLHSDSDLAAANERQTALEGLLAQEGDRRASLDQELAALEAARQEADRRHTMERADAAATKHALEQVLADAQSAHQRAVQRAAADLASAAERQSVLEDRLAQQSEKASSLEQQLADAQAARQDAERRHAAEVAEAGERLATESEARAALERDLTHVRMESARARHRFLQVVPAYRRRSREQKARLEAQIAAERADADRERCAKDEEIRQLQLEHETLRHLLGTTQDQLQHLHRTVDEDRQAYERARLTSESELQRVSAEYDQLRQSFDALQSAFQTLEQVAADHVAERARLESVVADRDSALREQADRHRRAEEAAQEALAQLEATLRQTVEARAADITRLEQEIDALRRQLEAARSHAEGLRPDAERAPVLQAQLERTQQDRRAEFERAPYGLCRCTHGGVIVDANHSFVTLLGRRHIDELRNKDFAAAACDCAGDLEWVFERLRTGRKIKPIETTWKTSDGRDRIVRLQALATTTGTVEIIAEDITNLRALEERLRQAHRLEAVGRLASEVAVSCDALLRDALGDTHEWLAASGDDDARRRHGERVATDVTRAAGFLRKLGAYGDHQMRALEPVSAAGVLRDLAPVLKQVVGDDIDVVLPKSGGSFDVDIEAERLERVFVNVADYARERMPGGGQIEIELATVAVGRKYLARYPNVRPGDHVLITVSELPRAGELRGDAARSSASSDKPGIDVGALVDLVGRCGGHLWIEAQPQGSMLVKIHLPKPAALGPTDTKGLDAERGGRLARWFRSTSATRA